MSRGLRPTEEEYQALRSRGKAQPVAPVAQEILSLNRYLISIDGQRVERAIFRGAITAKPRQTRSDKWKERDCVMRYRAFADDLRRMFNRSTKFLECPLRLSWTAYFTLPKSWSRAKREAYTGQPHRAKPDRDNIDKAILDALFKDDSGIAGGTVEKFWDDGQGERLEIALQWN